MARVAVAKPGDVSSFGDTLQLYLQSVPTAAKVALVIPLWLMLHPFTGCRHDGLLYTFQALAHNEKPLLLTDLMLRYFNQGDLSVFTSLYASVVAVSSPYAATVLIYHIGQALWFAAALFLCRALFENLSVALFAMFCLCFSSGIYLSTVFVAAETFVTARLYAEAFALLGFACFLRRHNARAFVMAVIACLFHPLIGIWCLFLFMGVYALAILKRYQLIVLVVVAVGLAFWVFWLLGQQADSALNVLQRLRTEYLYPSIWGFSVWARAVHLILLLLLLSRFGGCGIQANLSFILAIAASAAIVLTLMGDLAGNQSIIALQVWRVFFLAYIWGLLASVRFLLTLPNSRYGITILVLVCLSWYYRDSSGWLFVIVAWVMCGLGVNATAAWVANLFGKYRYLVYLGWLMLVGGVLVNLLFWFSTDGYSYYPELVRQDVGPVLLLAIVALLLVVPKLLRTGTFLLLGLVSLVTFANTTQTDIQDHFAATVLRQHTVPTETIYWEGELHTVWHGASRSYYASPTQLVPSIFSNELFEEGLRRLRNVVNAGNHRTEYLRVLGMLDSSLHDPAADLEKFNAIALCGDKLLDWVVLDQQQTWPLPGHVFPYQGNVFLLVRCDDVRKERL